MIRKCSSCGRTALVVLGVLVLGAVLWHQADLWAQQPPNSYAPVVMQEDFDKVRGQDVGRQARNHGTADEALGGAVRPE